MSFPYQVVLIEAEGNGILPSYELGALRGQCPLLRIGEGYE